MVSVFNAVLAALNLTWAALTPASNVIKALNIFVGILCTFTTIHSMKNDEIEWI